MVNKNICGWQVQAHGTGGEVHHQHTQRVATVVESPSDHLPLGIRHAPINARYLPWELGVQAIEEVLDLRDELGPNDDAAILCGQHITQVSLDPITLRIVQAARAAYIFVLAVPRSSRCIVGCHRKTCCDLLRTHDARQDVRSVRFWASLDERELRLLLL